MPRSGGPVTVVKNTQRNKIVMYGMRLMQTGAHHVISSARKVILNWPGIAVLGRRTADTFHTPVGRHVGKSRVPKKISVAGT